MKNKDWIEDAARELALQWPAGSGGHGEPGYLTDEQRSDITDGVKEIIAKYCPFAPDVVYMPVPRCDTCRYWHGGAEGSNQTSDCRRTCVEPTAAGDQMDEFMTLPDFGCVLWESKP